jgi:Na+-driven multidrug efflux pump
MALFIGGLFTATKKTKILSISTIIGAFLTIGLNFLLIPVVGVYGASIAALVGYFITFVILLEIISDALKMAIVCCEERFFLKEHRFFYKFIEKKLFYS